MHVPLVYKITFCMEANVLPLVLMEHIRNKQADNVFHAVVHVRLVMVIVDFTALLAVECYFLQTQTNVSPVVTHPFSSTPTFAFNNAHKAPSKTLSFMFALHVHPIAWNALIPQSVQNVQQVTTFSLVFVYQHALQTIIHQ